MKQNDYIFIKKDYGKHILVCLWVVSMLIALRFCLLLNARYRAVSRELELRKGVSVHSWIMTDSCSDQLMNSKDGILRIKLSKQL